MAVEIDKIDELVNDIKSSLYTSKTKILTASQVCVLLGLSRYKLIKYYNDLKLPIQQPFYKGKGGFPRYSYADVETVREIISNHARGKIFNN